MLNEVEEGAAVIEGTGTHAVWRAFWFLVWGGMALVSTVNAWNPHGVLSGRSGIMTGILLAAVAATQITFSGAGLPGKILALERVVLVLFFVGLFGQRALPIDSSVDFGAYYVAANLAAEHPASRLYYQAMSSDGRFILSESENGWQEAAARFGVPKAYAFIYPPFFAILMEPFTYLRYGVAYRLWIALTVLLTIGSVWLSLLLGGSRLNFALGLILAVGLFSFSPFFQELAVGQVASLILFLCAVGVWLLSRSQDWPSSFCFAVATMIKLTPIIAIPILVIHRKWRWLAGYGLWMACLIAFSIWKVGWSAHDRFLHSALPSMSCGVACSGDVSIVAFIQELILGYVPLGLHTILPPGACLISKAVSFVILVLAMLQFYRFRRDENLVLHLVLVILLSQALSPITWMHHYVMALLPLLYLWCRVRERGKDILLLATVLVVGTNVTVFPLPLFIHNHAIELVLSAIVPCLTLALVFFRVSGEKLVEDSLEVAQ